MLRDLRITTRAVESRAGGELVMLLGELAVDQDAYAEVGTPVAARVTRLLVNAGTVVRNGQPLVELISPELGASALSTCRPVRDSNWPKLRSNANAAWPRRRLCRSARFRKRNPRQVKHAPHSGRPAPPSRHSASSRQRMMVMVPPRRRSCCGPPSTGSVIERTAVVGQMLDPAAPAFRIGNLSTLWLTVHAFERDAVRIQQGVSARLSFPALPGQDFDGTVTMVGRHVERESRTVPVRIDVKNSGNLLRPGMSATATLPVGATGAPILTVPVASVQRVRNEWCVFLPKDANHFEIRRIGRGRDLGGEVEVLSGLRAGENIVVDGAFLLKAQAEKGEGGHDEH